MVDGTSDERPVPSRYQTAGIALADRKDVVVESEEVEQDQRQEEVGDRLEEHEPWQHAIEPATVSPAGDDSEPGAQKKGDHRRGAHQGESPRDRLTEQSRHFCGVLDDVGAEIEVEDVVEVRGVLVP